MIVDGKALAAAVLARTKERVAALGNFGEPTLAIITCAPTFATLKYLALKERKARAVGVAVVITELPSDSSTEELIAAVKKAAQSADGVVVQLPLPPHIDRETVLRAIPIAADPDGVWYGISDGAMVSPVVRAIEEIATAYNVTFRDRRVVVVGAGRLVGQPVAHFLALEGASVTVVTASTPDPVSHLRSAEIIVSGAGRPGVVTPSDVNLGVLIFDAGTSEDGGELVGDVDPAVGQVAGLFTPVPGGIGPLTVATLLENVVQLCGRKWRREV